MRCKAKENTDELLAQSIFMKTKFSLKRIEDQKRNCFKKFYC